MCVCIPHAGFQFDAARFGVFYLTLALTSMAGAALAFTCSAMVSVFAVANLLVSLIFILYMVSSFDVVLFPLMLCIGSFDVVLSSWILFQRFSKAYKKTFQMVSSKFIFEYWPDHELAHHLKGLFKHF